MNERRTHALLGFLVLFDIGLVIWAGLLPDLWFRAFHGIAEDDPHHYLRRCAANWAAFALLQGIAFWRWKRERVWLAVVAGVRLSDIFTDITMVLSAQHSTWFADVTLAPMSVINLLMGIYFLRVYRARAPSQPSAVAG